MKNRSFWGVVLTLILITAAVAATAVGLPSCNVTRVITNESAFVQRGDTSVIIKTKTIETYDASKKGL